MFGLSPYFELENGQRESFIYKVKLSTAVEKIANIHFSHLIDVNLLALQLSTYVKYVKYILSMKMMLIWIKCKENILRILNL